MTIENCSRCHLPVAMDEDLNGEARWFTPGPDGTNFCGPRGRLSHVVDYPKAGAVASLTAIAKAWHEARDGEQVAVELLRLAFRQAAAYGVPETQIAAAAGVDRQTVRRALGKGRKS